MNAAADASGTAAENNAFWIPVLIVVGALLEVADKVLIAKDAVDIAVATAGCNNGSQADCDRAASLAKEAAIQALGI